MQDHNTAWQTIKDIRSRLGIPWSTHRDRATVVAAIEADLTARGLGNPIPAADRSYFMSLFGMTILKIDPPTVPNGQVGRAYPLTMFVVSGAVGPGPIILDITNGAAPAGTTINLATGEFSGIPTAAGPFDFTLRATGPGGDTTQQHYHGIIHPPLSIPAVPALPSPRIGVSYSPIVLPAPIGGDGSPISVMLEGLPEGMTFNSDTRTISGTAEAGTDGMHLLQYTATDGTETVVRDIRFTVDLPIEPTITTFHRFPRAVVGRLFAVSFTVNPAGTVITVNGLPATFHYDAGLRRITGTPEEGDVGTHDIEIVASNSGVTTTEQRSLIVDPVLTIIDPATNGTVMTPARAGELYTGHATTNLDHLPGIEWSTNSTWLAIEPDGQFSGRPPGPPRSHNITIQARLEGHPTAIRQIVIPVQPGQLRITTLTLPQIRPGQPYSATLNAEGGTGQKTWSISRGTLPTGIRLNRTTGLLSGQTNEIGDYVPTFKVTDEAGQSVEQQIALIITHSVVNKKTLLIALGALATIAILAAAAWIIVKGGYLTTAGTSSNKPNVVQPSTPSRTNPEFLGGDVGPKNGNTLVVSAEKDQMVTLTGGPMRWGNVDFPGGTSRGSVLIFLGPIKDQTVTNLTTGENWWRVYNGTDYKAILEDRIKAMREPPNCTDKKGCAAVDYAVIGSNSAILDKGVR